MNDDDVRELQTEIKELQTDIEGLYSVVMKLVDRVSALEKTGEFLSQAMNNDVSIVTRRAYKLRAAMEKTTDYGYLTRGDCREILTEHGKRLNAKSTSDAMTKASELFGYVYRKNTKGLLILAKRV